MTSAGEKNIIMLEVALIQHLIWDVDGTLFDTYPAIARSFQAAAHDLGAPAAYDEVMRLALVSVDHCLTTCPPRTGWILINWKSTSRSTIKP